MGDAVERAPRSGRAKKENLMVGYGEDLEGALGKMHRCGSGTRFYTEGKDGDAGTWYL